MIKELTPENTPEVLKKCAEWIYPDIIEARVVSHTPHEETYSAVWVYETVGGFEYNPLTNTSQWKDLLMDYRDALKERYIAPIDELTSKFWWALESEEALVIAYYNLKMEG